MEFKVQSGRRREERGKRTKGGTRTRKRKEVGVIRGGRGLFLPEQEFKNIKFPAVWFSVDMLN